MKSRQPLTDNLFNIENALMSNESPRENVAQSIILTGNSLPFERHKEM